MAVIKVTTPEFESQVLKSEVPVLVDFNADWCGPCRMLKPILDQISDERTDVKIVGVNIDDEDELAENYDVSSIPCLVLFEAGKEVKRSVGLIPKDAIAAFAEDR